MPGRQLDAAQNWEDAEGGSELWKWGDRSRWEAASARGMRRGAG